MDTFNLTKIKLLIPVLALALSGCATGCREACLLGFGPGNATFDRVALNYDSQDPCQGDHRSTTAERRAQLGRPDNYVMPDWCGRSSRSRTRTVYIYDKNGQRIGSVR